MAHAKLSPSSSKRWLTCPGSIDLIETINVVEKPSKFAAEGTVAHQIGEECLLNDTDPIEYKGRVMEADGFKFTVTEEMIDAVEVYVDYVRVLIHDALVQADLDVELNVEVKCSLKHLGIEGLDGGTTDCLLVCKEHQMIWVLDYKHGQGVAVEPEGNTQAMQYALGALEKLDIQPDHEWTVSIVIVQPRLRDSSAPIKEWVTSSDYLFNWQEEVLIPGALATQEPDAPLVPSDDGCRFCAAAGSCKALYQQTQETAMVDFEDMSGDAGLPDPRLLTPQQKMMVMEHIDTIRAFLVNVEKSVTEEVEQGSKEYESKFKLVRKTTHRKLEDIAFDDEFSPLVDIMPLEELMENKVKSVGAIEKQILKTLEQKHDKKVAKQMLGGIMAELTTKPEGGLVIAPLSDKRKAEITSAQNDFKDLV